MSRSLEPGGDHGGDAERIATSRGLALDEFIDLSASMNPFAPDVSHLICRHAKSALRYPDTTRATRSAAQAMGVEPEELLLTNGGAEAIALACSWVAGTGEPFRLRASDFSLYRRHLPPNAGAIHGRLIASNPSSPSGDVDAHPIRPEDVLIWDEAFWPLAFPTWTSFSHRHGIIVTGSFTKVFACPGLRLGYLLADPVRIRQLRDRQPRWSVSTLALDVLPDLLAGADLPAWSVQIPALRTHFAETLRSFGFDVLAGVNWVRVERLGWTGTTIRSVLLEHRVVVRDCASFGFPGQARIALPTPAQHPELMRALSRVDWSRGAPPQ